MGGKVLAERKTEMTTPLQILSLGAGVQSSTVLLMSCKGLLPKLDAAIFADTQWEPPAVYEHLAWLETEAAKAGIPVQRVTAGNLREATLNGFVRAKQAHDHYASLPLYVISPAGIMGRMKRQCTQDYKMAPIERFIRRELLGLAKGQIAPADAVEHWFGISADEQRRIRVSEQHWKTNIYPLCNLPGDFLPKMYTRNMCMDWLRENYPGRAVPRSSCIGCPFHSNAEWRLIKADAAMWADVCEVDDAIRHADGMKGEVFLHHSCRPLREANLDEDQMTLPFVEECLGLCGN